MEGIYFRKLKIKKLFLVNYNNIILENGKRVSMPPNVHSVPALLQVKKNYNVILGEDIIKYLNPRVQEQNQNATSSNGEPMAFQLIPSNMGMNIISEQYTLYNMSSDELSAKGKGGMRQMYNYMPASHDNTNSIPTPPDTYNPDKVASNVTIDTLEQKRQNDVNYKDIPSII